MTSRFDVVEALNELKKREGATATSIARFPTLLEALGTSNAAAAVGYLESRVEAIEDREQKLALLNAYGFVNGGMTLEKRRSRIIGADGTKAKLNMSLSTLQKREAAAIEWLEKDILGEIDMTAGFDVEELEALAAALKIASQPLDTEVDEEQSSERAPVDQYVRDQLSDPDLTDEEFRAMTGMFVGRLSAEFVTSSELLAKLVDIVRASEKARLHLAWVAIKTTHLCTLQGNELVEAYNALRKTQTKDDLSEMWTTIKDAQAVINEISTYVSENLEDIKGKTREEG